MTDWRKYITSDPEICHGQLGAKGTRVLVTNILDSLAEGASREETFSISYTPLTHLSFWLGRFHHTLKRGKRAKPSAMW